MAGERNHACHECLAWHHKECFFENKGCSACGNHWVQNSTGNGGYSLKPLSGRDREHADVRRAEAGPKKEPSCKHKFNPMDMRCDYCHKPADEHAQEVFGVAIPSSFQVAQAVRRGAERRRDFAAERRESEERSKERARKRKRNEIIGILVMVIAFLLGLLHVILTSLGYIPS